MARTTTHSPDCTLASMPAGQRPVRVSPTDPAPGTHGDAGFHDDERGKR